MNECAGTAPDLNDFGSFTPSLAMEFLEQVAHKALGDLQQESTPINVVHDYMTNRGKIPN